MITLSDGKRECVALEYSPVQGLSLDTPPGTKVRVSNASVVNGVVLLEAKCCSVVGGVVKAMKEDWETQRRYSNAARRMMIKETRTGGSTAEGEDNEPPPKFTMFTKGAGVSRPLQHKSEKQSQQPKSEKQAAPQTAEVKQEMPPHKQKKQPPAQQQYVPPPQRQSQQQQQQQATPPPRRGRGGRAMHCLT